jgi:hypothetical protein
MRFRRLTLAAMLVLVCTALLGMPAQSGAVIVGIGDQKAAAFSDPLFQSLGVKRTRLITPWNSISASPDRLDQWVKAARAAKLEMVIAFNPESGSQCPASPCVLPSTKAFTAAFKAFRKKYPDIKIFQPWNEANSPTQPTGKNPKRAAEYYNAMVKACRKCKVTAADILDIGVNSSSAKSRKSATKRLAKWVKTFQKTAKGKPKLWGIHNYGDTNRRATTGTKIMLALMPGEIWVTETGGVYEFRTQSGDQPLGPPSETRQKQATEQMYKIAKVFKKRIKRLYIYQWSTNFVGDRFDAGLVRPDGTPRPAFDVVKKNKSLFK